jgi:hypothetical protein
MCMCLFCVCVVLCLGTGLATSSTVWKMIMKLKNRGQGQRGALEPVKKNITRCYIQEDQNTTKYCILRVLYEPCLGFPYNCKHVTSFRKCSWKSFHSRQRYVTNETAYKCILLFLE